MTNLLEKSLLTGFSIFILIMFLTIVIPFFGQVEDYKKNTQDDLDEYLHLFYEIDESIKYIIENPNETYEDNVKYPKDLNITLTGKYIKYDFTIEKRFFYKIYYYKEELVDYTYNLHSGRYTLTVYYNGNLTQIKVQFSII